MAEKYIPRLKEQYVGKIKSQLKDVVQGLEAPACPYVESVCLFFSLRS